MNKKGNADEGGKRKTRRTQKFQKAIVGMSLEDIRQKKAQKPQLRQQAKEAAIKEAKGRQQKKPAGGSKPAQPKAKAQMQKAPKGSAGKAGAAGTKQKGKM